MSKSKSSKQKPPKGKKLAKAKQKYDDRLTLHKDSLKNNEMYKKYMRNAGPNPSDRMMAEEEFKTDVGSRSPEMDRIYKKYGKDRFRDDELTGNTNREGGISSVAVYQKPEDKYGFSKEEKKKQPSKMESELKRVSDGTVPIGKDGGWYYDPKTRKHYPSPVVGGKKDIKKYRLGGEITTGHGAGSASTGKWRQNRHGDYVRRSGFLGLFGPKEVRHDIRSYDQQLKDNANLKETLTASDGRSQENFLSKFGSALTKFEKGGVVTEPPGVQGSSFSDKLSSSIRKKLPLPNNVSQLVASGVTGSNRYTSDDAPRQSWKNVQRSVENAIRRQGPKGGTKYSDYSKEVSKDLNSMQANVINAGVGSSMSPEFDAATTFGRVSYDTDPKTGEVSVYDSYDFSGTPSVGGAYGKTRNAAGQMSKAVGLNDKKPHLVGKFKREKDKDWWDKTKDIGGDILDAGLHPIDAMDLKYKDIKGMGDSIYNTAKKVEKGVNDGVNYATKKGNDLYKYAKDNLPKFENGGVVSKTGLARYRAGTGYYRHTEDYSRQQMANVYKPSNPMGGIGTAMKHVGQVAQIAGALKKRNANLENPVEKAAPESNVGVDTGAKGTGGASEFFTKKKEDTSNQRLADGGENPSKYFTKKTPEPSDYTPDVDLTGNPDVLQGDGTGDMLKRPTPGVPNFGTSLFKRKGSKHVKPGTKKRLSAARGKKRYT